MTDLPTPPPPGALAHWERIVRLRWKSGAAVFATVFALAAAMVLLSRPIYRAEARLKLGEPPPMSGVSPAGGILSFFRGGGDPFANDMEMLASRTVAEGVVEDAALHVILDAPRGWHRDSLFTDLRANRSTAKATYRIERTPDGAFAIAMTAPRDSTIGSVSPGDEITLGGITLTLNARHPTPPDRFTLRTLPFPEAVRVNRQRLVATRTRRDANVLDISYDHQDPGLVTQVVTATVNRFLALRATVQRRESGQTVDSLRRVARETLAELRQAEAALEAWQERTKLVVPEAQSEAVVRRYSDFSAQLALARAEVEGLDRLLARVEDPQAAVRPWTELASFPRFVQNQTIGDLVTRLTELDGERLVLAARRREENRDLRLLSEQIAQLETALLSVVRGYRQAMTEQQVGLERQVAGLDSILAGAPRATLELARRQRDVRLLSEIYLLTEQRLRQEELREALTFSNIQVIDPPALRDKPVWPRKRLGLGIGFMLGTLFGALAMLLYERADRSVRTAHDITRALEAPILVALARGASGEIEVTRQQAEALTRQLGGPNGVPHLAPTGARDHEVAAAVARSVSASGLGTPQVMQAVESLETAAAATLAGAPLALVIDLGRTDRLDLQRAAHLLRANGAKIAGAIVVIEDARDGHALFA